MLSLTAGFPSFAVSVCRSSVWEMKLFGYSVNPVSVLIRLNVRNGVHFRKSDDALCENDAFFPDVTHCVNCGAFSEV